MLEEDRVGDLTQLGVLVQLPGRVHRDPGGLEVSGQAPSSSFGFLAVNPRPVLRVIVIPVIKLPEELGCGDCPAAT